MRFNVGAAAVELREDGDRICAHIAAGKTFETDSLRVWAELCGQGGMVLDIGGYTGLFSISAALLGCMVIAFEPMPVNAERFRENAKANKVFGEIALHEMAVADRIGQTTITYNPKVPFTSGASLIRKKGWKLPIQVTTIDALDLDQVTAIKIDVERGEPEVLAGARETLKRCRPALLVEVLDDVRRKAVLEAVQGYEIAAELDVRNWLLLPC